MKAAMKIIIPALLIFFGLLLFGKNQTHSKKDISRDPANVFPFWNQSWKCGKWRALGYQPEREASLRIITTDKTLLYFSMCEKCESVRIVDPTNKADRIILSHKGQKKQHCMHKWISALTKESFEPIETGDALFIICKGKMYGVIVQEIFGRYLSDQKISYQIAKIEDSDTMPTQVNLKKLTWKKQEANREIPIADHSIIFTVYADDGDEKNKFLSIEYDQYYAYASGTEARPDEEGAHIAIVHKSYLEENPVIDLTKFRFKIWEDGLSSRGDDKTTYDQPPPKKEPIYKEPTYIDSHNSPIRDIAVAPNGNYFVSIANDQQVIIHYLDLPLKKVIGPFPSVEVCSTLSVNQDGTTVLAGGHPSFFGNIVKINVADGKYELINISLNTTILGLFYYNNDRNIASISAGYKLSFFDLEGRKLIGSNKIFGGFLNGIAVSRDRSFFAVISTNMDEVSLESIDPSKLTIFNQRGDETLSYQFDSIFYPYSGPITFLTYDCLALCLPTGEMWKWRWSTQSKSWEVKEKLKIPKGHFTAIEHSPDGKTIWVARDKTVLTIDTTTGETSREYDFDIKEVKTEFGAWPITVLKIIPNKQILAVGLKDGRIALMPID